MKLFKHKKGNYQDIPQYVTLVIFLFFIIMISFLILTNFNNGIQSSSVVDSTSKSTSTNFVNGFLKLDFVIPIIFLVFVGFSVLAARFIPSSPKFMIISVLFLLLMPLFAMFGDNITNAMLENPTLLTVANNYSFSKFFFTHLTLFATIYSFIIAFALLTKHEAPQ